MCFVVLSYFRVLLLVALERFQQSGALWDHHLPHEGLALEGVLADLVPDDDHALGGAQTPIILLEAPDQKSQRSE